MFYDGIEARSKRIGWSLRLRASRWYAFVGVGFVALRLRN